MKITYIFFIISRSILLRMRNVSGINFKGNKNTRFVFNHFFFSESSAVYEMWKNTVEWLRPQMTIWRMRTACWITKGTHTHNMQYSLLFHCHNGCTNAPQY